MNKLIIFLAALSLITMSAKVGIWDTLSITLTTICLTLAFLNTKFHNDDNNEQTR